VLSPTRTYAPVIRKLIDHLGKKINGMIHCSGGAQTKILHFVSNLHIVKDNLFDVPPLFRIIHEESGTDWKEMYKVFNMGHRMEIYLPEKYAQEVIDISNSFNIDAQIVGRVEDVRWQKSSQSKAHTVNLSINVLPLFFGIEHFQDRLLSPNHRRYCKILNGSCGRIYPRISSSSLLRFLAYPRMRCPCAFFISSTQALAWTY
jgi:hypothetical protein